MKRFVLECFIILTVVMFCMLYGAVTIRDAQQTQPVSQQIGNRAYAQKIIVPDANKADPSTLSTPQKAISPPTQHGYTLSEKVQRFFLFMISGVAEVVEGFIHALV
ncbi:hypothetical protein ACFP7A_00245 [Sporolactobacillus kofuensis]|uniref:Uncharacterized protein n=1 Tax=Sporolactobacillus kofuensis TaxID=269672 RepID=A0ABW1WBR7_9BACL|nr:hypothetical protein [Sporolactobacillus kofuensis]MCO7175667.1 hypothetical protein [Sporolactobacillus kofuensis]